jgi:hypothetical protein
MHFVGQQALTHHDAKGVRQDKDKKEKVCHGRLSIECNHDSWRHTCFLTTLMFRVVVLCFKLATMSGAISIVSTSALV